ncbi:rhodanese-like domain-containing protein [Terrabacter sp. NPDC080008]|uniref:rhodanese-like domain-containing protein n=1 Tax=Terrabacter sp. NPDC080008 TaxID=3155176 RepID=UPI00344E0278
MSAIPTTTVSELPDDAVLVDVREPHEWEAGHAPGAIHIPLGDLPARMGDLPETDDAVAIVCRSGGRSARAVQWLAAQGYDVVNVEGGMLEWQRAGKQLAAGGEPTIL